MAKSGSAKSQHPCYICHEITRNQHEHHVTMRARTGELGPKIWLCGSCHTEIHAVANARVAALKGGKPNPANLEWSHARHPHEHTNAETVIKPLVRILLSTDGADLPVITSLQLPVPINNGLKKLQLDLGLKNKPEVVLYCCAQVLSACGLLDNNNQRQIIKGKK